MSERQRGLGRGLAALLSDAALAETVQEAPAGGEAAVAERGGVRETPIELIAPNPDQPRKVFTEAEIDDLTASIREKGVLQPLLVRPAPKGEGWQLVAGERRWRASQRAGLKTVPVIVRELDDLEVLEIGIVENVQRADLNPIEEAMAYKALMERFARTQDAIAQVVGKSRSHVANTLRLLKLPQPVQTYIQEGKISAGHARMLVNQPDPERLAREIMERGLNVRQVEALAQERAQASGKTAKSRARTIKDADTVALEKRLSDALGLAVTIDHRGHGGVLSIRYRAVEQLDEVIRRLEKWVPAFSKDAARRG
jgi:ParB family transcriptional regulator, chromosome partitioning protein